MFICCQQCLVITILSMTIHRESISLWVSKLFTRQLRQTFEERGQQNSSIFCRRAHLQSHKSLGKNVKDKISYLERFMQNCQVEGLEEKCGIESYKLAFPKKYIARSNRQFDLEYVISNHESATINRTLMNIDGSNYSLCLKREITHTLPNNPDVNNSQEATKDSDFKNALLVACVLCMNFCPQFSQKPAKSSHNHLSKYSSTNERITSVLESYL